MSRLPKMGPNDEEDQAALKRATESSHLAIRTFFVIVAADKDNPDNVPRTIPGSGYFFTLAGASEEATELAEDGYTGLAVVSLISGFDPADPAQLASWRRLHAAATAEMRRYAATECGGGH